MKNIEILVVEDEKGWRETVEDLLSPYNINLDFVDCAETARIKMESRIYDAMLVDVGVASFGRRMLLDPIGYSFVDWVREEYPNSYIIGWGAVVDDVDQNHFNKLIDKCCEDLKEKIIECLNESGLKVMEKQ